MKAFGADERCDTCICWKASITEDHGGYCRRHPPTIPVPEYGEYAVFPLVADDGWCGEYRPSQAEIARRRAESEA